MGYRFIRFPEGKGKAVTFSYDDGSKADIRLAETLDRYGMKGTFNINSAFVGANEHKLTADEIREHILDKGHEVALHGATHIAPGRATPLEGIKDTLNCRLGLEKMFGRIIRGMAYPDSGIRVFENGSSLDIVKGYLADLGVAYSRTLAGDNDSFRLPDSWYEWMPTAHHDNPHIMEWIDKFLAIDVNQGYISSRSSKLFYIWGHAFEFEGKGNWNHLEAICEKLSGKEDTWYATNIEIYDYVTAYNSLIWSADGTTVYNPTLKTVWFTHNVDTFKVESGETVRI